MVARFSVHAGPGASPKNWKLDLAINCVSKCMCIVYIYIHIYFYLFVHTCVAVYMDICCVSVIVQVSRGFLALPPDTKRHRVDDHTGMYIDALYLVCMNRYNISHYVYRQNTLSV